MVSRLLAGLDTTVVFATHDLDFALEVADRVVVLDRGRVVLDLPSLEAFYGDELYMLGFPRPLAVEVGLALGRVVRSVSC